MILIKTRLLNGFQLAVEMAALIVNRNSSIVNIIPDGLSLQLRSYLL